jgi:aminomethyltransferase
VGKQTALYQQHLATGARMVDFAGWDMPIQYTSVIDEHNAVRGRSGMFDVSHMTIVDITGPDAKAYLQFLLANDVDRLAEGQALYSAMLNEQGGVVDDLIIYRLAWGYRMVVNCATREKDLQWMALHARDFLVSLAERPELAIIAVHGPQSIDAVCSLLPAGHAEQVRALGYFRADEIDGWFIARTGYTGERGLEIILPEDRAPLLWEQLRDAGVTPVGLGARDTLRLEAGMNLYGHDMDETVSPLAANMGQTIAWEPSGRDFIGRAALEQHRLQQETGDLPRLVGLVMEERGVLREGMTVHCKTAQGAATGVITSGTFSPTLKHAIALARVPAGAADCQVDIRGRLVPVIMVKPSFVRFGKKVF